MTRWFYFFQKLKKKTRFLPFKTTTLLHPVSHPAKVDEIGTCATIGSVAGACTAGTLEYNKIHGIWAS